MPLRFRDLRDLLSLAIPPLGTVAMLLLVQAVLEHAALADAFVSRSSWAGLVRFLGGVLQPGEPLTASVPPVNPVTVGVGLFSIVTWLLGAGPLRSREAGWMSGLVRWGRRGWCWWLAPGAWWLLWHLSLSRGGATALALLAGTVELWLVVALAGWAVTWITLRTPPKPIGIAAAQPRGSRRPMVVLTIMVAAYIVVFTGMNWGLWFNLRLPHGDSAMYEEHLWNLEHGKGFRSYLDQGLFLGEHLQVIHVLLLPLHLVWPSHLLLELCESAALASGAIPVFLLARRRSGSDRAALLLAAAYLLYFPLQYLDVAIDLKTFRPIAFGVPLLLWAIERMERGRYVSMTVLLLLTFSAKEDYAIVIGLLGAWLCLSAIVCGLSGRRARPASGAAQRTADDADSGVAAGWKRQASIGAAIAVLAGTYLFLAVKVIIPWFRGGETVHYARYFERFGETPGEILYTMLTQPGLLFAELFTAESGLYVARLLVPLAALPLLSPSRFLVGLPLIVLLCLNEVARDFPGPVHHFHAPLIPVLFWAAAAGLRNLQQRAPLRVDAKQHRSAGFTLWCARMACGCAFTTGLFWSLSPVGVRFWDPGAATHWRTLYLPDERARAFEEVAVLIPPSARVASTDFVHPRFTHHERSYDYSDYRRAVADYEDRVPHDTDYIVIDIEHPYHTPDQIAALRRNPRQAVRELREEPHRWELLPETGGDYFLVLKRIDAGGVDAERH